MSGEITGILSGARAQEIRLEVLSNNMANVNTVGFKEDRVFRIPPTPSTVIGKHSWSLHRKHAPKQ